MVSLWPPTELAEGYYYERYTENYVISDGERNLNLYYVHPLEHVDGMTIAFLPDEGILVEADLFDTHVPLPSEASAANRSLHNQVARLGLDVSTIVPIHGRPAAWSDFLEIPGLAE